MASPNLVIVSSILCRAKSTVRGGLCMVINREAILAGILKHKSHFFRFVDVINANETALQLPMTAYLKFYE